VFSEFRVEEDPVLILLLFLIVVRPLLPFFTDYISTKEKRKEEKKVGFSIKV
jgi:hypothetical protein